MPKTPVYVTENTIQPCLLFTLILFAILPVMLVMYLVSITVTRLSAAKWM